MAELVLGPILRYVDERRATIWVETDAPCTVNVLGRRSDTFTVGGHHFALVVLEDLTPGTEHPYSVELDGRPAWPDDPAFASSIRTIDPEDEIRLSFGSCRTVLPHEPPFTLRRKEHASARGVDALYALAKHMRSQSPEEWPHVLLLLGDQVYVDEGFPETRRFIEARRDTSRPPGTEVADFEEYTRLYLEGWRDPIIRWVMSNVSCSMIFDDHDIADDWNISADWIADIRSTSWWEDRICGGLASYWIYQHLGNLNPEELRSEKLLEEVRSANDGLEVLQEFALEADREPSRYRWSFRRDLGSTRLVVVDSRAARTFESGRRDMLDETEWTWLEEQMHGAFDHLLLGSSLPLLMPPGFHGVESGSEMVAGGRWGRAAARAAEWLRRKIDLEDWAAFGESFDRIGSVLENVATSARRPKTVAILSGDLHFSYVAAVVRPQTASHIYQIVCSPIRNPVSATIERVFRFGCGPRGAALGRWLAARAGAQTPRWDWRVVGGPWFDNVIGSAAVRSDSLSVTVNRTLPGEPPQLQPLMDTRLD